jgi:hypothetical protein
MNTLDKLLKRKTRSTFMHYHKTITVELLPGDIIRLRLHGQRDSSAVSIEIPQLYYELVRRRVAAKKNEREKVKRARRKARPRR